MKNNEKKQLFNQKNTFKQPVQTPLNNQSNFGQLSKNKISNIICRR